MHSIPRSTDRRNITSSPITEGTGAGNGTLRRLFVDRTIRCWLCVIALGTAGCIFGARMPYAQSSAVAMSVLWWGFYFGCFGMWLGAVLGMWAERIRVSKSKRWDGKADQIEHPSPTRATINPQGVVRTGPNEQSITKQYVGSTSTHSLHEESS